MEFLLPGVVLGALAIVWMVGWIRQRGATSDQRGLIADLEGKRVEGDRSDRRSPSTGASNDRA